MRKLTMLAAAGIAATIASPVFADPNVTMVVPSQDQGVLVHGNGGAADVGLEVTGDLGSGWRRSSRRWSRRVPGREPTTRAERSGPHRPAERFRGTGDCWM